jgi:Uma2 family endonuclease
MATSIAYRDLKVQKTKKLKFPQPKLLTFDDYARLTPPDSGNYELHNGKIIYMPSPLFPHQDFITDLLLLLASYVKKSQLGKVVVAPMDVIFTPNDTVQPDILFISNERLHIIDGQIKGAPDLVVEILSDGNTAKEMSYKKHLFETHGVKEYWLINLKKQTLSQYENIEGEFFLKNVLNTEGVLSSIVVEGFQLNMNEIFQKI